MAQDNKESTAANLERAYAEKFWQLGNIVTGFSLVQMITFLTALGTSEALQKNVKMDWAIVAGVIIGSGILYALAVVYCWRQETKLVADGSTRLTQALKWTGLGRIGIVVIGHVCGFLVIIFLSVS